VCQWSRSQALATIASRLTLDSLKATYQDVLDAGADHEQLIEALLTLARSQQDLEDHETFDLAEISRDVIETHQHHAAGQQVAIDTALSPAPISGDPRLARTLLTNLLENALGYNVPHGRVNITLRTRGHRTTLTINNIGPTSRPARSTGCCNPSAASPQTAATTATGTDSASRSSPRSPPHTTRRSTSNPAQTADSASRSSSQPPGPTTRTRQTPPNEGSAANLEG
jgi:hypothetical protein